MPYNEDARVVELLYLEMIVWTWNDCVDLKWLCGLEMIVWTWNDCVDLHAKWDLPKTTRVLFSVSVVSYER